MELRNKDGLTESEFLALYKPSDYEKPSVTADILLFTIENYEKLNDRSNDDKELQLLLIKRKNHPYMNKWALPGGFIDMNESIDEAAYRELEEETNLKEDIYLEQLYTFSKPNRDPRMRVISTAYMALTPAKNINKTKAGDDASDALWFSINKKKVEDDDIKLTSILTIENKKEKIFIQYQVEYFYETKEINYTLLSEDALAFDHIEIIDMGLTRLKNKVSYTTIAFNLLPELFTLTDLQQVYEILLGETLVKPNFRKKIEDMVIKTDILKKDVGYHRPYLYKKNPKFISEK